MSENTDYFDISVLAGSEDYKNLLAAWNQGIDSRLEAFVKSKHEWKDEQWYKDFSMPRLWLYVHKSEIQILVRRLLELENEAAELLADDIIQIHYGVEVI